MPRRLFARRSFIYLESSRSASQGRRGSTENSSEETASPIPRRITINGGNGRRKRILRPELKGLKEFTELGIISRIKLQFSFSPEELSTSDKRTEKLRNTWSNWMGIPCPILLLLLLVCCGSVPCLFAACCRPRGALGEYLMKMLQSQVNCPETK